VCSARSRYRSAFSTIGSRASPHGSRQPSWLSIPSSMALVPNDRVAPHQRSHGQGRCDWPPSDAKRSAPCICCDGTSGRRPYHHGQAMAWTRTAQYNRNLCRRYGARGTEDSQFSMEYILITPAECTSNALTGTGVGLRRIGHALKSMSPVLGAALHMAEASSLWEQFSVGLELARSYDHFAMDFGYFLA